MTAGTASPRAGPLSPRRAPLLDVPRWDGLDHAMRLSSGALFRLIFYVRVEHLDRNPFSGQVLIAENHRGLVDAPLVVAVVPRPAAFLAKSELFRGVAAGLLRSLGPIPVDRGRAVGTALRAVSVLGAGGVPGIFPGGSRGAGALETVRHGIAYLALRVPGVRSVPVACPGTERALPNGARLPRPRRRVDLVFGPPFTMPALPNPRARRAVATAAGEIRLAPAAPAARVARAEAKCAAEADPRRRSGAAR